LPGTPEFKAALNRSINDPSLVTGSKFQDASKYYHSDANYNFSHLIDFAEIQVGGSYRKYKLNSSGTIYTDADSGIDYSEVGFYTQIQKKLLDDKLKLTGSVRYDKSELFDAFFSPRLSVGYTLGENDNHNIRASVQTGFRNPSTQDLFIGLDAGFYYLVGSAESNLSRFSQDFPVSSSGQALGVPATITQTGEAPYFNSYTATSVSNFGASLNPADLEIANPELVKPEQITSFEVGYRGKLDKVIVDLSVYYNQYKDFLANQFVISPYYGTVGDNSLSIAAIANGDRKVYQTYTNSKAPVNSFGGSIGASTKVFGNFDLNTNYTYAKEDFDKEKYPDFRTSFNTPEHKVKVGFGNTNLFENFGFNVAWRWSDTYLWQASFGDGQIPAYHTVEYAKEDFDKEKYPDFRTSFNTPEHKVKVGFGNTNLFENFGFNVAWRWSDTYLWQASFGDGQIPAYHTVDAQINLRVPSFKSTFKAGATNILGDEYTSAIGTGYVGSMYYVSWTVNNL